MEDFILREIDRLGEMLLMIARRLGLPEGNRSVGRRDTFFDL